MSGITSFKHNSLCMLFLSRVGSILFILLLSCGLILSQNFQLDQKLFSEEADPLDNMGISVDISGNYMVVGAWGDDQNETGQRISEAGAVYLYKKQSDDSWKLLKKLLSPQAELLGYFGFSVGIDQDIIAVGAYNEAMGSNANAGAVYVYKINNNDEIEEITRLTAPDAGPADYFGYSVAIHQPYLLIGAHLNATDLQGKNPMKGAGAAYLFTEEKSQWELKQKLLPPIRNIDDNFAKFLDISANRIIIGAEDYDDGFLFDAGSAYIYTYEDATGEWIFEQQLLPADPVAFKDFGWGVAIHEDLALVGASAEYNQPDGNTGSNTGTVYAFERSNQGEWREMQKIYAPDFTQNDFFGRAISMNENLAIIGADMEDEDTNGENTVSGAGSAYIYQWTSGNWEFLQKITGTYRATNDWFGASVAMDNDQIAVGAWSADAAINGNIVNDAGAAYVFFSDGTATRSINAQLPKIGVFPNPASEILLIDSDSDIKRLTIYNTEGQLIRQFPPAPSIDISYLPGASYFLKIDLDQNWFISIPWIKN